MNPTELERDERASGSPESGGARGSWWRFAGHYLEMVLAMLAGMLVVGGAVGLVVDYSHADHPTAGSLEMAFAMSVGMVAWMRYRGHGWAGTLEMTAAMCAPLVVLLPLLWAGVISGDAVMMLLHVLMLPAMLVAMLRRRDEYRAVHHGRGDRVVRVAGRAMVVVLALALLPAPVYLAGSRSYEASQYTRPEATTVAAAPPAHDPAKRTVAVVVGNEGANIADALVSYEVLAATRAFNVYTVAPARRAVPLLGGLDLVPDLDFAELGRRLGGSAPDVTVVPAMADSEPAVTAWVRDTASRGLLLSVCTGAEVLAEAGLLDGRDATSHWYRISGFEQDHPEVNWRRGIRYVDDGNVISTGGLLSAVDGSLRVVERLLGDEAATAAARTIGWRHYSPGKAATLPDSKLTVGDAVLHTLNVGFRWDAPTVGVVLTNGVGEIELAAAFDPYAEHSMAARTLAVGTAAIRSRHGLTFVPRAGVAEAADRVDRLLVPGAGAAARPDPGVAAAARRAGVPVKYLQDRPGFAFDAGLRDVASTMDVPTARWAAKILEYPVAGVGLSGPGWPWTLLLRPLLLGLAGLVLVFGAARVVRSRRS
ncbi:DJ-1/PfpI family protein [Actinomadura rugatobispora]|uniref:DJ-1/PfpI family protein n=1 Tax=Actinomadura rugatobispora TaxID=1994 RepID=A0ABW1AB42_9ACTN|nr:hypothetical protein GCM10010200_048410 [Actinomadura rugatobispora]